jgi:hypothetical protein
MTRTRLAVLHRRHGAKPVLWNSWMTPASMPLAGERRCFVLVPDFQRHRFDVDRLTIVLALQAALDLILRRSCPEHPQEQHRGDAIIRDSQRNVSRLRC